MGKTQHFGLNKFGSEGRISDEGYKFSLRDRDLIDTILNSLMTHDHSSTAVNSLPGPPAGIYLVLAVLASGGTLPAGRDYYYKFSYLDADGNETQASSAILASTPDPIIPPATQNLSTATTGGSLVPGTYKYAIAFYQDAGGVTTAPNLSTITIPLGTSTNTVTIPLPTLPGDADGWKLYRKGPGDLEYWLLDTVASGPTEYVDDGSISPDCTQKRPIANTTNSTNSIQIDLPASELPLDTRIVAWNIYRAGNPGAYPANSLVATVTETTTEGGADLVTTYTDVGGTLNLGLPLGQTSVPQPPPSLDAKTALSATGGRLPPEIAPLGVHAFNLLLPGTLAAQTYHQFVPPYDMPAERIDAFFLTAPTGLTPSTDFLTVRFADDDLQNEIQALYNDAETDDEIQAIYNSATGGTFTLSDGVDTTSAIAFDASAATIETRLEADITSITDVTVTGSGTFSDPWLIEFTNPGATDIDLLTVDDGTPNLNGNSFISEYQQGHGITQVDLIIDQNQQAHFWQSSTTEEGSQEAEESPAVGGTLVSDNLATNDAAAELDTQNEENYWNVGVLGAGDYVVYFWVSDVNKTASFDLEVIDDHLGSPTVIESASWTPGRSVYTPAYELRFTSTGTEDIFFVVTKTDAPAGLVRIDKYAYEFMHPVLHGGSTVTAEVLVTGTPTTNGDDLQLALWY